MKSILQGTTPTLTLEFDTADLSVENIVGIEFAIKQQETVTVYGLSDVTLDTEANTVSYTFSEEETLAFVPNLLLFVQARMILADGNIVGTDQMAFNVDEFIGAGVSSE